MFVWHGYLSLLVPHAVCPAPKYIFLPCMYSVESYNLKILIPKRLYSFEECAVGNQGMR
jgi:hypothetical protein